MPNPYDRIIQENIEGLTKSLVQRIMNIQQVDVVRLPRKVQRTMEREMDSLLKIVLNGEKVLLNVEWQAGNDPVMCQRMLLYHAHSLLEHELPVLGLVIYFGRDPVNMQTSLEYDNLKYDNLKYQYRLVNLIDLNPETFIESDFPEDVIMAVLAGNTRMEQKREIIQKILHKLCLLLQQDSGELGRRIGQLEVIGKLRDIQEIIIEEENKMAIIYDIKTDIRYNQGLEKGLEGLENAIAERNTAFVKYLLENTSHSLEEIAEAINVSIEFVRKVKASLPKA